MSGDVTINGPSGDPAALMALADQLDKQAGTVGDLGANTLKTTQGIQSQANWTGPAASAYTAFTTQTSQGVSGFEPPLHNVANAIRTYAGVLQKAQKSVSDAVNTANNDAKSNSPNAQTSLASAQNTATAAQTEVNNAAEQASKDIGEQKSAFDEFIEKLKPYATANDWAHAPLDASASDLWLDKQLEAWAKNAEGNLNAAKTARTALDADLNQAFQDEVGSVAHDFDNGLASMEDVESAFAGYSETAQKAISAADDAVNAAQRGVSLANVFSASSKVMGGLAIVGDVYTIINPEEKGAAGVTKQVMAGANIAGTATALLAANASVDWIPVAGEVVAAGSGLYLLGDALYQIPAVHNFVNSVGSGIASGAKSAWHWVSSLF